MGIYKINNYNYLQLQTYTYKTQMFSTAQCNDWMLGCISSVNWMTKQWLNWNKFNKKRSFKQVTCIVMTDFIHYWYSWATFGFNNLIWPVEDPTKKVTADTAWIRSLVWRTFAKLDHHLYFFDVSFFKNILWVWQNLFKQASLFNFK